MSNSHLVFQLPQCFITLLSKQGACFPSILISFPKWLLEFLLDCSSIYCPFTPRTASSLAGLTSSASLLPTHSRKTPSHQLGARSHCCFHRGFLSFLHVPTCFMFPFCCGSVSVQEDHSLFIIILFLCWQVSRCQQDEFLMFLLTCCMQIHGLEMCPETQQQHGQRSAEAISFLPSFTSRAGVGPGAEVL